MDLSEADWIRLERYLSGQATSQELAELESWIRDSTELRALAEGMRLAGRAYQERTQVWDTEAAWRCVSRRMRWFRRPPAAATVVWHRVMRAWAVAASLAVLVGSSLFIIESRERAAPTPTPPREVQTRRGERAVFNLADGSQVVLGPESQLSIPAEYNHPGFARDLHLEGQAYFIVTHDSLRPFRVNTPLGTAQDLGTEFIVSTYPEVRGMRVIVASGKVALRAATAAGDLERDALPLITLSSGDFAQLDSLGTATVTRVDPQSYTTWTTGALVFNGTPLADVLPQLARWYDLDIRLASNALATRRLTATFSNQSATQVLDLLALSLSLKVERVGRTITLRPSVSTPRF